MNEFLAGCIREHIAKSEKGVRHFSPSLLAPVYEAYFRYPGENGVSRAEIIIRDVLKNYFLLFSVLLPHMGKHLSGSGSDAG